MAACRLISRAIFATSGSVSTDQAPTTQGMFSARLKGDNYSPRRL